MASPCAHQNRHPKCFIIAGPNGAGKTTFALTFLPAFGCNDFINADEIARGLSPLNPTAGLLPASKIFLENLEAHLRARKDFAFETTLAGRYYLQRIREWQQDGWKVSLIYLYLSSPKLSEDRVMERVMQGGHDIPKEDIYRRYPRSLKNLFDYAEVCDHFLCLDNSNFGINVIFEKILGSAPEIRDRALYEELLKGSNGNV